MDTHLINKISSINSPTSAELKDRVLADSDFAKRTRYLRTEDNQFTASLMSNKQSTWAITSIEKSFVEIAHACSEISEHLKKRVQCNAYYTPAKCQGLPVHYDLHDVLVLQIEGSKQWKVWNAFRKTVSHKTLQYDEAQNLSAWTESKAMKELNLIKGDYLFLTAGEPHVAIATFEPSLHFSFGVYND